MAKRRRPNSVTTLTRDAEDDHSTSDYDGSDGLSDTSYQGDKRKRKAVGRKPKVPKSDTSRLGQETTNSDFEGVTRPHPSSSHIIKEWEPLQAALLEWYQTVHSIRGMPWRKPYDPLLGIEERGQRAYEVWVSEIMLQQTQVATVIPYYTRWMTRFPTVRDLAVANVDEVNGLWKGLGYYSRASRLLTGAQKAVEKYHGRLPDNAKDMEANIPGIGRYSAGAIASIAYGEHAPVLDGNVHRLLSRFLALHAPPKAKATVDILWAAASAMVEPTGDHSATQRAPRVPKYPGDINQALIELGSTVCKVRDPTCDTCPLQTWCQAYQISRPGYEPITDIEDTCTLCEPLPGSSVTVYPMKADRKKPREELDIVSVIEWCSLDGERWFLMVRRPDGGLLAGLYEFPTSSNVSKATTSTAQAKIPHNLLGNLLRDAVLPYKSRGKGEALKEFVITSIKPTEDIVHVFSHIRKTYRPQWVVVQGGDSPPAVKSGVAGSSELSVPQKDVMWVRLHDVGAMNMGTGVTKIWTSIEKLWK